MKEKNINITIDILKVLYITVDIKIIVVIASNQGAIRKINTREWFGHMINDSHIPFEYMTMEHCINSSSHSPVA